jgi:hypothetical protein
LAIVLVLPLPHFRAAYIAPHGRRKAHRFDLPRGCPHAQRPLLSLCAEKPLKLPDVSDRDKLRQATAAIVQQDIPLTEAAEKYSVDPDMLFIWHRIYINFIGKETVALGQDAPREKVGFDRETSLKFDENWAEMLRRWELERPQLSPFHKRLIESRLTGWMFRGEQIDKITVSGAIAALAFTGLAVRGSTNYLGQNENRSGENARTPAAIDPTDPDSFKGESQEAALTKVAKALRKFAKLPTWQERLPFVRNPDEVKPLMAKYYETHSDGPIEKLIIDPQISFIQRGEGVFALLQGRFTPKDSEFGETQLLIFLAEAQEGEPAFLFDWKVLVNYEPTSWEDFIALKSTEPASFRLRVAPGDYYNQPFMDAEKYASYTLFPLHRDKQAFGFVERGTPLAKRLKENVAKELNQNRAMILYLSFPEKTKFDNVLKIDSIVSDGWLED